MATSLEVRVPLLDHKLIDFVTKVPASLKLAGTETKHLLKRVARDLIPRKFSIDPSRGSEYRSNNGSTTSFAIRYATLREPRTRQRGYVNSDYVDLILDEHHKGRRDHSFPLVSLDTGVMAPSLHRPVTAHVGLRAQRAGGRLDDDGYARETHSPPNRDNN